MADAGHVLAMQSLAHIYEQGLIGVARDPGEAARWRKRAGGSTN
jgi:TPR repeat protein